MTDTACDTCTLTLPEIPPERVAQLSQAERDRLMAVRYEYARRDTLEFLQRFAWTCDQHDRKHPLKPFPLRPHIVHVTKLWLNNRLLVVCKSRQMMMTWLFSALALWDAMMHRGRLIMLQSKREADAIGDPVSGDGLLGRVKYMIDHMPGVQQPARDRRIFPDGRQCRYLADRVSFREMGSTLWAVPQGAAIIRQRTASGILSDEAAFQDEFADAYVAARPCIRGGGWFVALSTAHPGFFQRLFEDTIDADR